MASLGSGKSALVRTSVRSGNPDLWFGAPGEREDLNPPPYIEWIERRPAPNPDDDDPISFRARDRRDRCGRLLWTLNGVAQDDLAVYDDGTHGDNWAGDGVWSIEHAPLPGGSQVWPIGPEWRTAMAIAVEYLGR